MHGQIGIFSPVDPNPWRRLPPGAGANFSMKPAKQPHFLSPHSSKSKRLCEALKMATENPETAVKTSRLEVRQSKQTEVKPGQRELF